MVGIAQPEGVKGAAMRRPFFVLVVLIGLVGLAAGETRQVTVPPGMVELRIEAAEGATIGWEARDPLELDLRQYEGGTVAVTCAHEPGKRLIVASDVIDWDARTWTRTTWVIVVEGDPGPKPPDPPDPGPDPPPPNPPDPSKYGLDKLARETLAKVGAEGRELAPQIAANFLATASAVAAGGLQTIDAARSDVQRRNRATLGALESAWRPWLYPIGAAVDRLEDAGQFPGVKDYGRALAEIGRGLQ